MILEAFESFYFEDFEFDYNTLQAKLRYSFDEKKYFEEIISFNDDNFIKRENIDENIINNILFSIHIAFWISYYKFFPTKKLYVKTGFLDEYQMEFWKKFYLNWLGEFFYTNNFSPVWLINFENISTKKFQKIDYEVSKKSLVPIGWWKDSIVSIELLKQIWEQIDLFTFSSKDNILYENTQINSWLNRLFVKRELSKNILEMINSWYYNWHVPITGLIAFVLQMVSYIYDYKYLVLSNEKSANFWNTFWEWIEVNHQWSKSLDFEVDFWKYIEKYISSNTKYFSLLRPFYEIKISELFSKKAQKYFSNFSSCNTNFKILKKFEKNTYWCESCPKCWFVFIILSAFLDESELLKIFSKNLYNDENLFNLFEELAWISWIKPFECVWTNQEVVYSLVEAIKKYDENNLPKFLSIFKEKHLEKVDYNSLKKELFNYDLNDGILPKEFIDKLQKIDL